MTLPLLLIGCSSPPVPVSAPTSGTTTHGHNIPTGGTRQRVTRQHRQLCQRQKSMGFGLLERSSRLGKRQLERGLDSLVTELHTQRNGAQEVLS